MSIYENDERVPYELLITIILALFIFAAGVIIGEQPKIVKVHMDGASYAR